MLPADVRRLLGGDIRLVDACFHDDDFSFTYVQKTFAPRLDLDPWNIAGLRQNDVETAGRDRKDESFTPVFDLTPVPHLPHFGLEMGGRRRRFDAFQFGRRDPDAVRFHLTNRYLNCALPDELWEVAHNLCRMPPRVVATSWKLFHFQDNLRLRLVTLFNTADLIQRIVGAIILSSARDRGELAHFLDRPEPILGSGSFGAWNETVTTVLSASHSRKVVALRDLLVNG